MSTIAILWEALGGRPDEIPHFEIVGEGDLPSAFAVSDLAATSVGVAGCAVAGLSDSWDRPATALGSAAASW